MTKTYMYFINMVTERLNYGQCFIIQLYNELNELPLIIAPHKYISKCIYACSRVKPINKIYTLQACQLRREIFCQIVSLQTSEKPTVFAYRFIIEIYCSSITIGDSSILSLTHLRTSTKNKAHLLLLHHSIRLHSFPVSLMIFFLPVHNFILVLAIRLVAFSVDILAISFYILFIDYSR